jgi:hypothetical protein
MPTKIPVWVSAIVIVGAVLMAAGAVIAEVNPQMLAAPNATINTATHVYAAYLVSRNLVLAVMLLAALAWRAKPVLHTLLVAVAFIQIADAVLDALEGRWPIVPGVFVLGTLFFIAAARISGAAFWKRAAWSAVHTT